MTVRTELWTRTVNINRQIEGEEVGLFLWIWNGGMGGYRKLLGGVNILEVQIYIKNINKTKKLEGGGGKNITGWKVWRGVYGWGVMTTKTEHWLANCSRDGRACRWASESDPETGLSCHGWCCSAWEWRYPDAPTDSPQRSHTWNKNTQC